MRGDDFIIQEVRTITTLLKDLSLKDITPPSVLGDANIRAIIEALDPELKAITADIKHAEILSRIHELDEQTLDLLAWQFHADLYDLTIPHSYASQRLKAEAVMNSLKLHMKKGTVWAIHEALRQIDIQADFIPWWLNDDPPYTFRLDAIVAGDFYKTSGRDILIPSIIRAVEVSKSARSYMIGLHVEIKESEPFKLRVMPFSIVDGEKNIPINYSDMQEPEPLFAAIYPDIRGSRTVRIHTPDISLQDTKYFRAFYGADWMRHIPINYPDMQEPEPLYTAMYPDIRGSRTVRIHTPDDDYHDMLSAEAFCALDFHIIIGVDLSDMEELLQKFEQRIFARLDEISDSINEVKDLLTWDDNQDD